MRHDSFRECLGISEPKFLATSYRVLRKLYGLRRGGDRVSQTFIRSTERLLSEDDIAKEVGFSSYIWKLGIKANP